MLPLEELDEEEPEEEEEVPDEDEEVPDEDEEVPDEEVADVSPPPEEEVPPPPQPDRANRHMAPRTNRWALLLFSI